MKIVAVTPTAAAASPSHPDHARWVKEQTLAREVSHQHIVGGTLRDAELANMRALERLANRKRKPAPKKKPRTPSHQIVDHGHWQGDRLFGGTDDRIREQHGVTVRVAKARALPPMPKCGLCRQCLRCRRELRLSQIMTKARQQDPKALTLVTELVAIGFAAQARNDYKDSLGRVLPFSQLKGHDRDKAVTEGADRVCDRSVAFMGQWR